MVLVCLFFTASAWAEAESVEIVAGGVKYPSMKAYKDLGTDLKTIYGVASRQDEELLRSQSQALRIPFDSRTVKTVTLAGPTSINPETLRALEAIGQEGPLRQAVVDFKQSWENPVPEMTIDLGELEDRLEAVAADRQEPVLLISQANRIRVLSLKKGR